MSLFHEYIQPLTTWLYDHPNWALLTTFLISFSESLAIVGSIVPGSVTMTAIGILAGAGIMRIDFTLAAATLGAIAGDSISYGLGYWFSDHLVTIWPFRKYPKWLDYGKDFFARHGSVSVLIGRFVGPVRSIIPVIAGMMRMNQWHFLTANVISAFGWAVLYVLPGVLIGAASSELSAETAARLFIGILVILLAIWLLGLGLKWLLIHTNQLLTLYLNRLWFWLDKHPRYTHCLHILSPAAETKHYRTTAFIIAFLLSTFFSCILIALAMQGRWLAVLNTPVYLFLQSLHNQVFDVFFIVITLIISPIPLWTMVALVILQTLYRRDWKAFWYCVSIVVTCSLSVLIGNVLIKTPVPPRLLLHPIVPSFLEMPLTLATALFLFFIFYTNTYYRSIGSFVVRMILLTLLILAGSATLYLGDNWLSNVLTSYAIGTMLGLWHWIGYRRYEPTTRYPKASILILLLGFSMSSYIAYHFSFHTLRRAHYPYLEQYVIEKSTWWHQKKSLLPTYSTNRIGRSVDLLNIQYAGTVTALQRTLEKHGWKRQRHSIFLTILIRTKHANLPISTQLYLNKKPVLIMTYENKQNKTLLVLRMWRSNYHLKQYPHPIWLGNVSQYDLSKQRKPESINPLFAISQTLSSFKLKQIEGPKQDANPASDSATARILMIKVTARHLD